MSQVLIPIKGQPHWARDARCGNIVNTNRNEILRTKKQREYLTLVNQKLSLAQNEILNLKAQVAQMEILVKGIIKRNDTSGN